jgi:hypothetical protein
MLNKWTKTLKIYGSTNGINGLLIHSSTFATYLRNLKFLIILDIRGTGMVVILRNAFSNLTHLAILNLQSNVLKYIENTAFDSLVNLQKLDLSCNLLSHVTTISASSPSIFEMPEDSNDVFVLNSQIRYLNLSGNRFTKISLDQFKSLHQVETIDISNNPIDTLIVHEIDMLKNLKNLIALYVVRPETCCLVDDIRCESDLKSEDSLGSCQDIIAHKATNILLWVYMVLCTLGNAMSFCWWCMYRRSNVRSLLILSCNLNVADGLFAVYLSILLAADSTLSGDVGYVTFKWRPSVTCHILSFLIMISVESSALATFLIACDRFMIIVWHPFKQRGMTVAASLVAILICWCLSVALPIVLVAKHASSLTNNACIFVGTSLPVQYAIT